MEGTRNGEAFACPGTSCEIDLVAGDNTFTYWALSSYGDSSQMGSLTAKVDATKPQLDAFATGTLGTNGWFITDVTVSASANDASPGSGLVSFDTSLDNVIWTPYTSALTFSDGSRTLYIRALDGARNMQTKEQAVNVDTVAPLLDRSITGTAGLNGWYISDVFVEATASDADPSSGLSFDITTDGANWTPYTAPVTLSEGTYDLRLQAKDTAGNSISTADYVNVDTTAPSLNGTLSGTMGGANWYVSGVQASVTVSDLTSGIAYTEYSPDGGVWRVYSAPVNFDDGQHSIQFWTTDMAGWQTESETFSFKVDTQGPDIHLPSRWYVWESGEFIVKDDHSKVVSVSYEIKDGQNRWKKVERSWTPDTHRFSHTISWNRVFADGVRAPVGTYNVRVYAIDAAGNESHKDAQIIIPAPNATPLPTFTPTATPTNTPVPTEEILIAPVMPQATATPTPIPPTMDDEDDDKGTGLFAFGSEPEDPTDPPATTTPLSPVLWGAAAAAAIGTYNATMSEKKRREEEAAARKRASQREKSARKAAEKAGRLDEYIRDKRKAKETAARAEEERLRQKDDKKRAEKKREQSGLTEKEWKAKEAQQAIWDANGAAIYAANQKEKKRIEAMQNLQEKALGFKEKLLELRDFPKRVVGVGKGLASPVQQGGGDETDAATRHYQAMGQAVKEGKFSQEMYDTAHGWRPSPEDGRIPPTSHKTGQELIDGPATQAEILMNPYGAAMQTYIAAGINVQRVSTNSKKTTSGNGPAQLSWLQLNTDYGVGYPSGCKGKNPCTGYGLGLFGQNPFDDQTAVEGMRRRIQQVIDVCDNSKKVKCDETDYFAIAGMANNGPGFDINDMEQIINDGY